MPSFLAVLAPDITFDLIYCLKSADEFSLFGSIDALHCSTLIVCDDYYISVGGDTHEV